MRAFIGAPLPAAAAEALAAAQGELARSRADVRWIAAASMHLTLKFLGEIADERIAQIGAALDEAAAGRPVLHLGIGRLGAFPDLRAPRVIRCDLSGDLEALLALEKALEAACARLGFAPEIRPFHPHLTLGRVKSRANLPPLVDCIRMRLVAPECVFEVDRIHLYRSRLRPDGAVHDVLETTRLGASAP